jgi:4'-phosphopantetheinyl transferase
MTLASAAHTCRFESVAPGVHLAWLAIPEAIAGRLPEDGARDYRVRAPLVFSADDARIDWLGAAELAQVNTFKSRKRQLEWLAGRLALKALAAAVALPGVPLAEIDVAQTARGAPYLPAATEVSISLSHSHDLVVAGAALEGRRLGLDLELVDAGGSWPTVARLALSAREQAVYSAAGPHTLCALWVLKEAYLKLIGQGFHAELTRVEVLQGKLWHHGRAVRGVQQLTRRLESGHAFAALWQPPAGAA